MQRPTSRRAISTIRSTAPRAVDKSQGPIVLGPRQLASAAPLTISPDMISNLTSLDAEVQITLTASGGCSVRVQRTGTGALLGNVQDLQRLAGARSFYRDLEKGLVTTTNTREIATVFVRGKKAQGPYTDPKYPLSQETAARAKELSGILRKLNENLKILDAVRAEKAPDIAVLIQNSAEELRGIYAKNLALLTTGSDITMTNITNDVKAARIPLWLRTKLIGTINPTALEDIYRLPFPAVIGKGITFSLEEIRSDDFVKKNACLFTSAAEILAVLTDAHRLRILLGLPKVEPDEDASIPPEMAAEISAARITIPPAWRDKDTFLGPKIQGKGAELPQRSAFAMKPKNKVEDFSVSITRIKVMAPMHANQAACVLPLLFADEQPNVPWDTFSSPTDMWGWMKEEIKDDFFEKLSNGSYANRVFGIAPSELGEPAGTGCRRYMPVTHALEATTAYKTKAAAIAAPDPPAAFAAVDTILKPFQDDEDIGLVTKAQAILFPKKEQTVTRGAKSVPGLRGLTKASRALIEMVSKKHGPDIGIGVTDWLKSFSTSEFEAVAADRLMGNLDMTYEDSDSSSDSDEG